MAAAAAVTAVDVDAINTAGLFPKTTIKGRNNEVPAFALYI